MMNHKTLLLSLSGLLILVNFSLLMVFDPEVNRWGRVLSTLSFLALFLSQFNHKKILLLGALIMLLISDIAALEYQKSFSQKTFFTFQSLAYFFLIWYTGRYLIKQKFQKNQLIYLALVFLLNTFFMLVIGDLLSEEVRDPGVEALFYLYGTSSIILISTGILYYDRYSNDLAASFLIAVIGLVLSNLMGFPAHFMDFWEFFYLDRLFYVLGTAGIVTYSYYLGKNSTQDNNRPLHDLL